MIDSRDPHGLCHVIGYDERPGRAVFLSHSSYLSPFRIGSHQLSRAFAARDWQVLHVPLPVTPAHGLLAPLSRDYRRRVLRACQGPVDIEPGVSEIIPFVWRPWPLARRAGAKAVDRHAQGAAALRRHAARLGFMRPDLLFIDEPRMSGLAAQFDAKLTLYRATDLYHQLKGDSSIVEAERVAMRRSAGFIATSRPVFDHLRGLAPRAPGRLIPNGVEFDRFSRPAPEPLELHGLPRPRLVYAGALDARFDWTALQCLAAMEPHWQIILIGPESGRSPGWLPPNVHRLGARPYESLPGYFQHAQVGLLPLSAHPANDGRSPMKIFEYAAAGLPVVATATGELVRRELPFTMLYEEPEDITPAVATALEQAEALREDAIEAAREMSWGSRVDEILRFRTSLDRDATLAGRHEMAGVGREEA